MLQFLLNVLFILSQQSSDTEGYKMDLQLYIGETCYIRKIKI